MLPCIIFHLSIRMELEGETIMTKMLRMSLNDI